MITLHYYGCGSFYWKFRLATENAFEIDVIMTGRQLLGNYFLDVKKEFDGFYKKRNVPGLKEKASEMREILSDLELLNSFHNRASLDKWIEDARSLGDTDELKNYYEKNARNLITTWGGSLNDYASRTWAGLLNDYYARRWEIYFECCDRCGGERNRVG